MAKFSKKRVANTISITRSFRVTDEDTGEEDYAICTHIFRRPTGAQLLQHKKHAVKAKGRKLRTQQPEADFWLWKQCIVCVKGYEDDGLTENANQKELLDYFDDNDIGRIHADEMIGGLLDKIQADDAVEEKKSAQSSEESSGQRQKTPTPSTK